MTPTDRKMSMLMSLNVPSLVKVSSSFALLKIDSWDLLIDVDQNTDMWGLKNKDVVKLWKEFENVPDEIKSTVTKFVDNYNSTLLDLIDWAAECKNDETVRWVI